MSRARLLTYLWQWHEIDSLAAWLAMGCLVFGAGAALFPWVGGEHFNRILFSLRAGAASGLMFLGLGLLQTIVTPPFFGTDEPAHIFSYHLWMTDLDAVEKTWVLGERNHAIRMMWRPAQKFTAANIDHPLDRFIDSPSTMYTRPGGRSATALRAWRAFRRFVTGHDPAEMILRLRLLSLAGAALCLAAGVAAMAATSTPVTPSAWLGWGLLLTPSLPYYAMNVSNYSWVLGGAFLLGAGISVLINQAETPWWSGMVIGLGASFSFFSSISGWPLAAVVLCSLAGVSLRRLIIDPGAKRRPSMRFWITTAAGLSPFGILSESQFAAEQSKYGQVALRHFGISHVPSYLALVWTVCGLLALLEWICAWLASESTAAFGARVARRAGILSWAILALVVVNLFIPVRQLEALPEAVPHWEFHLGQARAALPADADFAKPPLPSPARYALHAVRAVVSSLGFGRHDYLTEKLFWLAIGSIETSAPDWMFSVLSLFIAIGLVLLFWRIGATENGPRLILVLATLAGLIASLMLTAMGSILSPATPTLHGRYLMGFHVALLLLATVGFKGPVLRLQWRAPNLFAWLCLGSVILIHGSCLQLEWSRYF